MHKLVALVALALLAGSAQAKDSKRKPSNMPPGALGMPRPNPDMACKQAAAAAALDFAAKHLDESDCSLDGPVQEEEKDVTYSVKVSCDGIHAYEITTKRKGDSCKATKVEKDDEKPVLGRPRPHGGHGAAEEETND